MKIEQKLEELAVLTRTDDPYGPEDPDEGSESHLTRKLRRAWDMITGKY